MEYQKSAGLIVYYKNIEGVKFLLLKYPNYWGFTKGLIEKDENDRTAAVRELQEETGISDVEIIPNFKHEQEWFFQLEGKTIKKTAVFFLAKTSKEEAGKVKISFEHEDFAWLSYEEAIKKLKIKNNKEMLKKAYEFIKEYERQERII